MGVFSLTRGTNFNDFLIKERVGYYED